MKIGVPKETAPLETRVALTPPLAAALVKDGHEVVIETGAGLASTFTDPAYAAAGATVADGPTAWAAEVILKVHGPGPLPGGGHEADQIRQGATILGFLSPFQHADALRRLAARGATAYALEFVPRITRAQSMDALSSQATVAGYKAAILGAAALPQMFPLLMTAAGTISPACVLVLGAGVAGLQAIATAHRLGARVEAFDPRPAVREQVRSLGAAFVEMELPKDAETAGGYAKELSPEFIRKEMEAIGGRLPKTDLVICTAQVFGKRAPILISAEMVTRLRPGSVIVDLAAEQGGNCELTQAGRTVTHGGVSVIGAVNLPATVPLDASQLYARNLVNLLRHLFPKSGTLEPGDEIAAGACLLRSGDVVHDTARRLLEAPPAGPS